MRFLSICLLGLLLLVVGCSRTAETQSKAAIQAAIEAHLQQRQNLVLANMTLEVQDVKFAGDKAEAEVKFRSKQSPNLSVGVRYLLRRAGDRWQVESSSPSSGMGASPHGGAGPPAPPAPTAEPGLKPSH
jgi:hypothetical protein